MVSQKVLPGSRYDKKVINISIRWSGKKINLFVLFSEFFTR